MKFITVVTSSTLSFMLVALIYSLNATNKVDENNTELILLHVIFRHGNRTPNNLYPNDPHYNETFYPYGKGSLNKAGRLKEYNLGVFLRHLYDDFLGKDYVEDKVYVRSTNFSRTRMSALCVLAGIYPPSRLEMWNSQLLWQPIPVDYKSPMDEDIFHPSEACPYKLKVLQNLPSVAAVQQTYLKPYGKLFSYVERMTGRLITNPSELQEIYFVLTSEFEMCFTLPNWTRSIYPEPMKTVSSLTYGYFNYDTNVRRINAGYLLKKIIDDSQRRIDDDQHPKRIFLYSGHESTLGYILNATQLYKLHTPSYGNALIFELRKSVTNHHQYYIKILYKDNENPDDLVELALPKCRKLCEFQTFIKLLYDLLPCVPMKEACRASF